MPQRATPPPQRTRIDWGTAKARYVELGPDERSYARIHREFGVSEVTVQKHARRESWVESAAEADGRAAAKALQAAQRSIEERNARSIKLIELVRDHAIDAMEARPADLDLNVAVRTMPRLIDKEQLLAGEATSRIEVSEVDDVLQAVFVVVARYVPAEEWDAFNRDLDEAVGGLVAIEGAKAA